MPRNGASLNAPGDIPSDEGLSGPLEIPRGLSEHELEIYAQLPGYARRQVDKYLPLVRETEGRSRAETSKALARWNEENPELTMSARSLSRARKIWKERGLPGLASRLGASAGRTIVRDEWLSYFQSLYLKEGAPSAYSCWLITRGKFPEEESFPHYQTFVYQLRKRMPADAIYMARHGEGAWNRRYGQYIERDYSNILCGEVWVSDHAQVDVAASDENGKPFFPWVTAWTTSRLGRRRTGSRNPRTAFQRMPCR